MYLSSAIAGFDKRNNDKIGTFAKRLNTTVDDVRAFAHRMKTADQPLDAVRAMEKLRSVAQFPQATE